MSQRLAPNKQQQTVLIYQSGVFLPVNVWLDGEEEVPTLIYNIYISRAKPIAPFLEIITDHHVKHNSFKSLLGGDFNVYVGTASCYPFNTERVRPTLHKVLPCHRALRLIYFLNQHFHHIANGYFEGNDPAKYTFRRISEIDYFFYKFHFIHHCDNRSWAQPAPG